MVSVVDASTTVDVATDSFAAIMHKLKTRAYRGAYPEGGSDVPANLMTGQVREPFADYSLSFNSAESDVRLSLDEHLVPAYHKPEPVAKRSEQPFSSPFQDTAPAGLFGTALKAHAKLQSVVTTLGGYSDDLDKTFKDMWGIEQDADLSEFMSRPRSTGAAMWGGLGRDTVPAVLAMSGAQTLVNVVDRGKAHSEIDPEALIDWPRAKATVMATGVQLVADDDVFRARPRDLHFRLDRRELPRAPRVVELPAFDRIPADEVSIARETIAMFADAYRRLVSIHGSRHEHVEVENIQPVDILRAVRAVPRGFANKTEERLFDLAIEYDPFDPERTRLDFPELKHLRRIRPVDIIKSFALGYADHVQGRVPRHKDLQYLLTDLDNPESLAKLREFVTKCLPEDTLVRTFHLGNLVSSGTGWEWVNSMRKNLGARHSSYQERDLVRAWKESLNDIPFLRRVGQDVAMGILQYERVAKRGPNVSRAVCRELGHYSTFAAGLSKVVRRHAVYWHNRYLANKMDQGGTRVRRQLMAKVMKTVKVRISASGEVSGANEGLAAVMLQSAEAYLRKRRAAADIGKPMPFKPHGGQDLVFYGDALDVAIREELGKRPDYSYADFAHFALGELKKFVDDIADFLEKVFKHDPKAVPQDYGDEDFAPEEAIQEVPAPEPEAKQEEETVDYDALFGFGVYQTFNPAKRLLNLVMELADDGIDTTDPIAQAVIARYPAEVELAEYNDIRKEILETYGRNFKL